MTNPQQIDQLDQPLSLTDSGAKRPYLKPAFSCETVFETMALACGKIRGQGQDNCRRLASNS
ncbi:MAG: hypothetical protein KBF63_20885 [Rhodoferax sp.]|nr:hypothetical protein [Rhodoferax sp.]